MRAWPMGKVPTILAFTPLLALGLAIWLTIGAFVVALGIGVFRAVARQSTDELWAWPGAVVAIVAVVASQISLTGWLLLVFLAWVGLHLNRITYSLWAIRTELRRLRKQRRPKSTPELDLDDDLP